MKTIFQLLIPNAVPHSVQAPGEAAIAERGAKGKRANFNSLLTLFLQKQLAPATEEEDRQPKPDPALHLAAVFASPPEIVQTEPHKEQAEESEAAKATTSGWGPAVNRAAATETPFHAVSTLHAAPNEPFSEPADVNKPEVEEKQPVSSEVTARGENRLVILPTKEELSPEQPVRQQSGQSIVTVPQRTAAEAGEMVEQPPIVAEQTPAEARTVPEVRWQTDVAKAGSSEPGHAQKNPLPNPIIGVDSKRILPMPEVKYTLQRVSGETISGIPAGGEGVEETTFVINGPLLAVDETLRAMIEPEPLPEQVVAEQVILSKQVAREAGPPTEVLPVSEEMPKPESTSEKKPGHTIAVKPKPVPAAAENAEPDADRPEPEQNQPVQSKKIHSGERKRPMEVLQNAGNEFGTLESRRVEADQAPSTTLKAEAVLDLQREKNLLPKLTHHIRTLVDGERSEVRIQLRPDHLGEMRIKLSLERGVMVAEFAVQNEAVREIINSNLPQLHTALQDQGTNVAEMTVNIGFGQESKGHDLPQRTRQFAQNGKFRRGIAVEGEKTAYLGRNHWHQVDLKA